MQEFIVVFKTLGWGFIFDEYMFRIFEAHPRALKHTLMRKMASVDMNRHEFNTNRLNI